MRMPHSVRPALFTAITADLRENIFIFVTAGRFVTPNLDIAGIVLPVLQDMEGMHFESCQLTESRMYIKVVNTRLEAEVVPGDIVQSGIIISNSEVGLGSVNIQPLVYRLVCSNGMVVNDAQTRRNHVGRVNEATENYQLYSDKTLEADDKAFAMKIQDTVRAVVDEVRFTSVVNMMREAKDARMNTTNVPGIVKLVSRDFHITEEESSGVLQRLIEGNDLTLYGLSNAVTRHSQDVEDYLPSLPGQMSGEKKATKDTRLPFLKHLRRLQKPVNDWQRIGNLKKGGQNHENSTIPQRAVRSGLA